MSSKFNTTCKRYPLPYTYAIFTFSNSESGLSCVTYSFHTFYFSHLDEIATIPCL